MHQKDSQIEIPIKQSYSKQLTIDQQFQGDIVAKKRPCTGLINSLYLSQTPQTHIFETYEDRYLKQTSTKS